MGVCVCVCVRALKIVSRDKLLRFKNSLIIITSIITSIIIAGVVIIIAESSQCTHCW